MKRENTQHIIAGYAGGRELKCPTPGNTFLPWLAEFGEVCTFMFVESIPEDIIAKSLNESGFRSYGGAMLGVSSVAMFFSRYRHAVANGAIKVASEIKKLLSTLPRRKAHHARRVKSSCRFKKHNTRKKPNCYICTACNLANARQIQLPENSIIAVPANCPQEGLEFVRVMQGNALASNKVVFAIAQTKCKCDECKARPV